MARNSKERLTYRLIVVVFPLLLTGPMTLASFSSPDQQVTDLRDKYAGVLNIKKIPADIRDLDAFGFSDMGAWHAYSLPPDDSTDYHGGFCGPLLMKNSGRWLGKKSSQLIITGENGELCRWIKDSTVLNYSPGILRQSLRSADLAAERSLFFADGRTALVITTVKNKSRVKKQFSWKLRSELFSHDLAITRNDNSVIITMDDSSMYCVTLRNKDFILHSDSAGFIIEGPGMTTLRPGETLSLCLAESYFFNAEELESQHRLTGGYLDDPKEVLDKNVERWNRYLADVINGGNGYLDLEKYRRLAVKCIMTLVSNWRSPAGALKHNGLFPSAAYTGFYGFWSWDSWKHAVALTLFDDNLAKESVRSMFDFQNDRGMVADCIYHDSVDNNWRDTKPPLAAWAAWSIFRKTNDTAFIREIMPALMRYHAWWYYYRDNDQNGLCEYGSTDGTLIAAKWESGMDNAVRFDRSRILKNESGEWSLDQESVDLNAFLLKEKEYLSALALVTSHRQESDSLKRDAARLAEKISDYFWSEEDGWFMDHSLRGDGFIRHYGPEGWLPLWTGLADSAQAVRVATVMTDRRHFDTTVPLPTLDASDYGFDPLEGYWRGPVWIDQVYFGIEGLKLYGYNKEADALTQKLLENSEDLLADGAIRENYHPLTGRGLNARHFSWSAAHLLLLLTH